MGAVFLYASYDKILNPQAFAEALYNYQLRGLDVHSGCFSTQATHGPANLWTVIRDLCFLALSLYLLARIVFFPEGKKADAELHEYIGGQK